MQLAEEVLVVVTATILAEAVVVANTILFSWTQRAEVPSV
jgi:hypothetical protein